MKVSDLIEYLQTQPQHLTVVYRCCSEPSVLQADEIKIKKLCAERPDGWVQNLRDDSLTREYLVLPGN